MVDNDIITKLKCDVFDIMMAQEKLYAQINSLEEVRKQKIQELLR